MVAARPTNDADERLLDAAEMCLERFGVGKTTMEDVASSAGCSRGFVYKRFTSRDGLLLAVLVRRARRFSVQAQAFIEAQPSLAEALVNGILLCVAKATSDSYFSLLLASALTDPANQIEGAVEGAIKVTGDMWRGPLRTARERGELRDTIDIEDLIEWINYIQLMLIATRRSLGVDEARHERQLRELLVPAVVNQPTH